MAPRRPAQGRAAAALVMCALAAILSASLCAAQPAQGISLQDVCSAPSLLQLSKRIVVGTSCTVWTDCASLPLTAHACGAGERFSINDQACQPASSVPCYEDQWPQPAGAATNRALAKVADAPETGVANLTAGSMGRVAWTPFDFQMPAPHAPADGSVAAAAASDPKDASKNDYNYVKSCSTEAFSPGLHTPSGAKAPTVPAGIDYITRCTTCYPAILCPQSPKFSASFKGDYMTQITTDYYRCPEGRTFNGQACVIDSAGASTAAAATATPKPPAAVVTGSVTRGIDCDSLRAAIAHPDADATFTLVDTACNQTVAPVAFKFVNSTAPAGDAEVVTLQFKETSLMRWTRAIVYNVTTGVRGLSGDDQFTLAPTLLSSFTVHSAADGSCAFVPLVNGTVKAPAPGATCPSPTNPMSLARVADMPWFAVGAGAVAAIGLGIGGFAIYTIAAAAFAINYLGPMSAGVALGIFLEAAGTVSAATVVGVVVGVVLLLIAAILLGLILGGVVPPDLGISSGCFPASATVLGMLAASSMLGPVPVGQLALGDALATPALAPGGVYGAGIATSPVYLWGHREAAVLATFVELSTASGHAVQMTGGHFLQSWRLGAGASEAANALAAAGCAAAGSRARRAQDVSPEAGDWLCVFDEAAGTFSLSPVVAKRLVQAQGLYAPFTTSGELVVNGVLVSAHSDWLLDRIMPAQAVHHLPALYQALMWPARAAYALGGAPLIEFLDSRLGMVALASAARV